MADHGVDCLQISKQGFVLSCYYYLYHHLLAGLGEGCYVPYGLHGPMDSVPGEACRSKKASGYQRGSKEAEGNRKNMVGQL